MVDISGFPVFQVTKSSEAGAQDGFRLVTKSWKTPQKEKNNPIFKLRSAVGVYVPIVKAKVEGVLGKAMQAAIDRLQDEAFSAFIDAEIMMDTAINLVTCKVPSALFNEDGLAEFFASESERKRLSTDSLTAWFDYAVKDALGAKLASSAGITPAKLQTAMDNFKMAIVKLASPKAIIREDDTISQLEKCIGLADDDATKASLLRKLQGFRDLKETKLDNLL